MSNPSPQGRHQLILWRLIAGGGAELQKNVLPPVKKADRDLLVQSGLITADRQKSGTYLLRVTKAGFNSALDHMGEELGKSPAAADVLSLVLGKLKPLLLTSGASLEEVFCVEESPEPEAMTEGDPVPLLEGSIEERIESAYYQLSGGKANLRVQLADLRPLIGGTREEQDKALREMELSRKLTLYGNNNPREVSAADREAAFRTPAGTEKHLIYLGGPVS